ncbi:hypothetical protein L1887_16658 [Cichorium endivia]|nr:hypothetical protein L1887_16658 [Cichorium endivia]
MYDRYGYVLLSDVVGVTFSYRGYEEVLPSNKAGYDTISQWVWRSAFPPTGLEKQTHPHEVDVQIPRSFGGAGTLCNWYLQSASLKIDKHPTNVVIFIWSMR